MTYKDIYEQFLVTTGIDKNKIARYQASLSHDNSILVYFKDGNRLKYVAAVEIKGYAYFKDERKEREVITEYEIYDDKVTFRTKSGSYCYYESIEDVYIHDEPLFKCKVHQFGKIKEEVFVEFYADCTRSPIPELVTSFEPCAIEAIELFEDKRLIKSTGVHYL